MFLSGGEGFDHAARCAVPAIANEEPKAASDPDNQRVGAPGAIGVAATHLVEIIGHPVTAKRVRAELLALQPAAAWTGALAVRVVPSGPPET